ncbi:MAG: hypothetical protein KJ970_05850 [Candidatus Eisenbacteria bacterium]|uniref:Tetratricopeptide repeat protein n=1 Tax=Eiseniibacteriota bacterium TaxID=2212470 RepID=A0A948RVP2_UNCEI|nr:hypothetical protein [Candidatus Eisenbacteria bacterium]MBU1949360.1 hypothetical protein [Candidatus Eisenbacteria bacterium]MBU2690433.1 hypothetical protein [Candidatus Eisenbacteria bacterium]
MKKFIETHSPIFWVVVSLLSLVFSASVVFSQEEQQGESAAVIFERILADQGLEAAVTKFHEMTADSSDLYAIDGRELIYCARGMAQNWQYEESIALTKLLEELYPESPWPLMDLGCLYVVTGDKEAAESYLRRAAELNGEFPLPAWILENIDEQIEKSRVQIAEQGRYAPGEKTGRQGPYLGEDPPDLEPKIFANGLICSTSNEYSITFTPDGREIYFSRANQGTMMCRWEADGWTAPAKIELFGDTLECEEANVAPDGKSILFNARPTIRQPRQICRAKRVDNGWRDPEKLFMGMYATAALDGSIYYTMPGGPQDGGIGKVEFEGGVYLEPERVGGGVGAEPSAHPYIAPDESYMVFDRYIPGKNGLYICFRNADGSWGDALYLHDHYDIPPLVGQATVTPDGKYLFYSLHDDLYWVSTEIIETLRP